MDKVKSSRKSLMCDSLSSRKNQKLYIRVTPEEKTYLEGIAKSQGISLSNLIMSTVSSSLCEKL